MEAWADWPAHNHCSSPESHRSALVVGCTSRRSLSCELGGFLATWRAHCACLAIGSSQWSIGAIPCRPVLSVAGAPKAEQAPLIDPNRSLRDSGPCSSWTVRRRFHPLVSGLATGAPTAPATATWRNHAGLRRPSAPEGPRSPTPTNGSELRKQSLKTGASTTPKRPQPCMPMMLGLRSSRTPMRTRTGGCEPRSMSRLTASTSLVGWPGCTKVADAAWNGSWSRQGQDRSDGSSVCQPPRPARCGGPR
jgi:hypothetical protein